MLLGSTSGSAAQGREGSAVAAAATTATSRAARFCADETIPSPTTAMPPCRCCGLSMLSPPGEEVIGGAWGDAKPMTTLCPVDGLDAALCCCCCCCCRPEESLGCDVMPCVCLPARYLRASSWIRSISVSLSAYSFCSRSSGSRQQLPKPITATHHTGWHGYSPCFQHCDTMHFLGAWRTGPDVAYPQQHLQRWWKRCGRGEAHFCVDTTEIYLPIYPRDIDRFEPGSPVLSRRAHDAHTYRVPVPYMYRYLISELRKPECSGECQCCDWPCLCCGRVPAWGCVKATTSMPDSVYSDSVSFTFTCNVLIVIQLCEAEV